MILRGLSSFCPVAVTLIIIQATYLRRFYSRGHTITVCCSLKHFLSIKILPLVKYFTFYILNSLVNIFQLIQFISTSGLIFIPVQRLLFYIVFLPLVDRIHLRTKLCLALYYEISFLFPSRTFPVNYTLQWTGSLIKACYPCFTISTYSPLNRRI